MPPTGKTKVVRKVKKSTAGMSKSDINANSLASGNNFAAASKSHLKNNLTLQQHASGFGGPSMGVTTTSRVLSGNSNSANASGLKSQTLKTYSSTQNLTKSGLNNIRLKQLVQLQTKAIQGINSVQQQYPKTSQGMRISSTASQPLLQKPSTKQPTMKQFV